LQRREAVAATFPRVRVIQHQDGIASWRSVRKESLRIDGGGDDIVDRASELLLEAVTDTPGERDAMKRLPVDRLDAVLGTVAALVVHDHVHLPAPRRMKARDVVGDWPRGGHDDVGTRQEGAPNQRDARQPALHRRPWHAHLTRQLSSEFQPALAVRPMKTVGPRRIDHRHAVTGVTVVYPTWPYRFHW